MSWRRNSARRNSNVFTPARIASANCGLTDNKTRVGIGDCQQLIERFITHAGEPARRVARLHETDPVQLFERRPLRERIDKQKIHDEWPTLGMVPMRLQFLVGEHAAPPARRKK